jgi:hypothetical protein
MLLPSHRLRRSKVKRLKSWVKQVSFGKQAAACLEKDRHDLRSITPFLFSLLEVIKNSLSPQWVKSFILDYELGSPIKVAVNVFDEERKGDHKAMGSAVFDIGECLGARGNTKAKKLMKGGTLFASVRKSEGSGVIRMTLKGSKLKNVEGLLSKSDPFFEISRKVNNAGGLTWDNVYRSKHVKNNLNPDWEAAVIELSTLCGGDFALPLMVSVFDHESSGKHIAMGHFETSVNGIKQAAASGEPMKLVIKGKEVGIINIVKAEITGVEDVTREMAATSVSPASTAPATPASVPPGSAPTTRALAPPSQPDFVDYVSGGCQLNVMVAIDFTGSNGGKLSFVLELITAPCVCVCVCE